jgi:putative hydroxymethylpyrimidine transport system ATP-binding protein
MCGLDPAKVSTSFQLDDVMYMHQLPTLLPWLTVYDNIRIPNQLCRHDTEHLDKDIHHLLEQTSLLDVRDAYPHHLSVGMQQRVCFVRTLVSNRPLICLDEPFSSLDPDTRYMMHRLLASTMRDRTFILVTHDCLDVMRLAHRAYVIRKANQTACISPLTLPPFTLSVPRPYTYDTMGFSMTSEV